MHVVVTGAPGSSARTRASGSSRAGHHVTGLDSFDGYLYPAELKRANAAELARLPAVSSSSRATSATAPRSRARSIADVDVVCHLAALAGVRPSLAEPLRYLRTNIEGTGVIIERMRALGLQRLVFASSSSVYGAQAAAPTSRRFARTIRA